MANIQYDIVIVGGSLGGVAAALGAARGGANVNVCLIEATGWLGGQFTAQGVTKPDVSRFTDTVGSTAAYRDFYHNVRAYYRNNYRLSPEGANQPEFNPGGPYPGFATDPRVGSTVLIQMLTALPNVHLRLNTSVTDLEVQGNGVVSVTAMDATGTATRYLASYFLDATDLGDLLPLCGQQGVDWVIGAESQAETQEADAPPIAHPEWIQPITMPLTVEHRPRGENHTIEKPAEYDALKQEQDYHLADGYITTMFVTPTDMWTYRQFISAANFADPTFPYDITMLNMGSNDYQAATLPSGSAAQDAAIIACARQASLGYLYWLQTECPRDEDPTVLGYPELKVRTDFFGTPDGTSATPYIREGRRIKAIKTVYQQDIAKDPINSPGPRATPFPDSCGIGDYDIMDVHAFAVVGMPESSNKINPFQIPTGALIPVRLTNLLPACKNIGVTHLTNGAYRLHPVEWNVGESAGALAAFCLAQNVAPAAVPANADLLRQYQHVLLAAGVPLFWWADVNYGDPAFTAIHLLGLAGLVSGDNQMNFLGGQPLTAQDRQDIEDSVGHALNWPTADMTRGQAAQWLMQALNL